MGTEKFAGQAIPRSGSDEHVPEKLVAVKNWDCSAPQARHVGRVAQLVFDLSTHPNSLFTTILAGVCMCENESCDELVALLETHLSQADA
mgnify:CR=1 FL=1